MAPVQKQVSAARLTTARALMVMRAGEPTAAMAFIRSKRKGVDPDDTRWAAVESGLLAWLASAEKDTKQAPSQTQARRRDTL